MCLLILSDNRVSSSFPFKGMIVSEMGMASSKQILEMLRRPHAYAKFVQTGQLPQGVMPGGPLLALLSKISPHDRINIRGLRVDRRLGYSGSRDFATAEHALRWIAPQGADQAVFGSFPAESHRIKHMTAGLHIEDLVECAQSAPPGIADRYLSLKSTKSTNQSAVDQPGDNERLDIQCEESESATAKRGSLKPR